MSTLYIGLMSGTSLDGADGVLVEFEPGDGSTLRVLAHDHEPFDGGLRAELLALNTSGPDELHRASLAANALARLYARVVQRLRPAAGERPIRAVGAHGQTVRHRPREFDGTGYTLQLHQPALLAELTGLDVVADLRSRDVAAGGQGAPLVPAFHRAIFGRPGEALAVLNLGGIANLTLIGADGRTIGFDCGPANVLLDAWCERHLGKSFDEGGQWAASGRVIPDLLARLRGEPYFASPPPKSTGRDLFDGAWLDARLAEHGRAEPPEDVQATLAELTAASVAADLGRHASDARQLLVCGGGARNRHLMRRLGSLLPGVRVEATDVRGLPATQVEAAAFAWLARAFVEGRAGNLPEVTGARGPRRLGALYPAG